MPGYLRAAPASLQILLIVFPPSLQVGKDGDKSRGFTDRIGKGRIGTDTGAKDDMVAIDVSAGTLGMRGMFTNCDAPGVLPRRVGRSPIIEQRYTKNTQG